MWPWPCGLCLATNNEIEAQLDELQDRLTFYERARLDPLAAKAELNAIVETLRKILDSSGVTSINDTYANFGLWATMQTILRSENPDDIVGFLREWLGVVRGAEE